VSHDGLSIVMTRMAGILIASY